MLYLLIDDNIQELFSRITVGLFENAVLRLLGETEGHYKPQVANTIEINELAASHNSTNGIL
jgi:hypothetical protein